MVLRILVIPIRRARGGIADALRLTENFASKDKVVVILGDNLIEGSIKKAVSDFRRQTKGAKVLIKTVPDPERFGVADIKGGKIVSIIEKPKRPKSNYAITGIYMYDTQVFDIIKKIKPSGRGELEITDVNNAYLKKNQLTYEKLDGWWTDAGTFPSMHLAGVLVEKSRRKKKSKKKKK